MNFKILIIAILLSYPVFGQNNFLPIPIGKGVAAPSTYPTLNPSAKGTNITLSGGNLTATSSGGSNIAVATSGAFKSSGSWYCEIYLTSSSSFENYGLVKSTLVGSTLNTFCGNDTCGWGDLGGYVWNNGGIINAGYASANGTGHWIGFAFNATTGRFWWTNTSGTWYGSPSAGTGYANPSALTGSFAPCLGFYSGGASTINFGATSFAYTIPSGFSAWHN